MDDFEPFQSPKLLVDGAKRSLFDFEVACARFIDNNTYQIINHIDPKTHDHVVKYRFRHRVPPTLRMAASRILNDIRHALDQALCDGAVLLGRPNAKGIHFPIGKSEEDLAREIANKCKGVHPALTEFISRLKAHYRGDTLLYTLCALAGPNKHQRAIDISLNQAGFRPLGTTRFFIPHAAIRLPHLNQWSELHNELEFMRFGVGTQGRVDAIPIMQIVIGKGEPPLKGPAATVFRAFAGKVESIVLGIEAETDRILG